MPKAWEALFPNLVNWTETSCATRNYNCFAFAVGEETRRWEPFPPGVYYWPDNVRRGYDLDSFISAYETEGFRPCADGSLIQGREKIAIYLNKFGYVEHAARQEANGLWKSKLGDEEDIEHQTPECLSSDSYGHPRHFMERARNAKHDEKTDDAKPAASSDSQQDC